MVIFCMLFLDISVKQITVVKEGLSDVDKFTGS
jgi:hypothetical protein